MIKLSEIVEINKRNVYRFESNETKKRKLFISNYLKENFGEGKFYSNLKTYV
jgi:hypothetical protein